MSYTDTAMAETTAFINQEHKLLIGADRIPAASGRTLNVYNPATGKTITRVSTIY